MEEIAASPPGHIVHNACNESLWNVHSVEALFGGEIRVILRNCGLHHRRTKIGRIGEAFGEGVICEESQPAAELSPHIDPTGIVPTVGGILEVIDGRYACGVASDNKIFWIVAGERGSRKERDAFGKAFAAERAPVPESHC